MYMILIIGLGNPGRKYIRTRHNIGFRIIDYLQKENSFPKFKLSGNALISSKDNIALLKPQTFMNSSGKAIIPNDTLIVIHDDLDLDLGIVKISKDRGSAGHKGVESIIQNIGKDFIRIRIGIENKEVLKKFSRKEEKMLKQVFSLANKIIQTIISQGVEKAMNEYN